MLHSFLGCSSNYMKSIYERAWITEVNDTMFEDAFFLVSSHYDELLSCLYGDYMKIPPPEDRVCKEHAAILDLDQPYTMYIEAQKKLKIETYTRSIR